MGIIHQLDKHTAELIAAGEVVERPASVIKEVVENAIDAGATSITVEIKNGGMTFMRISDNGSGISRDDVRTAFLSHATSKIKTEDDLDGILTMGFRGEALASIAAVARVELLTRKEEELEGTRYQLEGSQELCCEAAGCPKGTTLLIRDLFFNTPARQKFVKKDVSEANAVAGVMDKMAVSHPEIAFRFLRDGELKLTAPGDGKLFSAVYAVFGSEFTKGLCEVHYKSLGLAVDGLISKPEHARANRSMQNFFINRRFVKSRTCAAALEEAFKGSMMVGRFPACILNLTLEPHTVDVNVHPAKIEVRFTNEKPVFDVVYFGVKNALLSLRSPQIAWKETTSVPNVALPQTKPVAQHVTAQEYRRLAQLPSGKAIAANIVEEAPMPCSMPATQDVTNRAVLQQKTHKLMEELNRPLQMKDQNPLFTIYQTKFEQMQKSNALAAAENSVSKMSGQEEPLTEGSLPQKESPYCNARIIGELFSTYILLENKDTLFMVDKHAAHERILFNRLKKGQGEQVQQTLLTPQTVTLAKDEYAVAIENLSILKSCGFEAEDFGGGSMLVRTAPMWLAESDISIVMSEICANLKENKHDITPEVLDNLYHSVACRSAVKAHDKSGELELALIVRLLEEDSTIQHCPHGRPVCVVMSRHELEKQFGRV